MALVALISAKGSPGVTVTALALTLTWSGPVILAECDPAGGDLGAGFLAGHDLSGRSVAALTSSVRRGRLPLELWQQLVAVQVPRAPAGTHLVLPGVSDPAQAAGLDGVWQQLAEHFVALAENDPGFDVVADCGRLAAPHPPLPVLHAAQLVLLVLRPHLASIRAAVVTAAALVRDGVGPLGLVIVGAGGPYGAREITATVGAPVVAVLPEEPRTARVLSHGGLLYHRGSGLLRAARGVEAAIRRRATAAPPATGDRSQTAVGVPGAP